MIELSPYRERVQQAETDVYSDYLKAMAVWATVAEPIFKEMKAVEGIWYVMTPYTKYPAGLDQAFLDAARIGASFTMIGLDIYVPIIHGHPQSKVAKLPPHAEFWWARNLPFIKASVGSIVVMMDGWRESTGIRQEIEWYEQNDKPIYYLPVPPLVPSVLR